MFHLPQKKTVKTRHGEHNNNKMNQSNDEKIGRLPMMHSL